MSGTHEDDDISLKLAAVDDKELEEALNKDPPGEEESDDEVDLTETTTAKRKAEEEAPNSKNSKAKRINRKSGPNKNGPKSGLPLDVQRLLATEIEADGGIEYFKSKEADQFAVRDLCDRNPGVFGLPGSKRREKVRNKIKYWRTYSVKDYNKMIASFMSKGHRTTSTGMMMQQQAFLQQQQAFQQLNHLQIPPGGVATLPEPTALMQQNLQRQFAQSSEIFNTKALKAQAEADKKQQEAAKQMQQMQMQQMQAQQMQIPAPVHTAAPVQAQTKEVVEIKEVAAEKKRKLPIRDDQKYETIQVDTNRPEQHRGIGIFEFSDAEKDGFLHHGYEIMMEGDIRDFMADNYKAQLLDATGILLRLPAVSYSFLNDKEEYQKRAKAADIDYSATEASHEAARKRFLRDPIRQERLVVLEFPEDVKLTNKVFSPDATNGEIDFDLLPITINVPLNGKDLPMTITRISWKVALVEKQPRPVKKDDAPEATKTKGAAKLANLF